LCVRRSQRVGSDLLAADDATLGSAWSSGSTRTTYTPQSTDASSHVAPASNSNSSQRPLDPTKVQHVADGRRAVQSAQRGVFPGENATPSGMRDVASTASDTCFAPRDVWLAQRRVWPAQRGVCSGLCVV